MSYLLPPVESWKQWSAIFTNMDLWRPVVTQICRKEGITCSRVEGGHPGTNAVWVVDSRYVVKIYNPVYEESGVERELLIELGQGGEVPVPAVVSSGRFEDRVEWDYLITEFIQGEPIRDLRNAIPPEHLIQVASRLGKIVRALHDTDVTALECVRTHHETGLELAHRRKGEIVRNIREKGLLPDRVIGELAAFLDASSPKRGGAEDVLVHGDLTEDHLYLKEEAGRWVITGLLDFGDAHLCPREYEWPALWLDLFQRDIPVFKAFLASYDSKVLEDSGFIERAFVWTLLHDFGTGIVEDQLNRHVGHRIRSLDDLRELLWPSGILDIGGG